MIQTRTIETAAANGGTACGPSSQSASCGNAACPGTGGGAAVDCEQSAWIDGTCSATCGGGTMTQTRTILTAAANGGTACGPSSQSASCGNDACPGTGVCTVSTTAGKRCNSPVVDDTGVTLTQCQDEATAAGMSHFSWRSKNGGSCEIPTDNSESQCVTNARNKGSWSVYTITCTSGGAAVDCEQSAWIDGTCSATC